ncbi:putative quinol monooxygenase [Lysobacter sp. Root690]|uniref:putative quinol monooxygenase n=1 Tax=Lysobacter sp. Root690 TaxID=1736588 RepID=UPI0012F72A7D|nr:putative quinol monooxygenase [Lysobacter sp. Root690]
MPFDRRQFIVLTGAAALALALPGHAATTETRTMYGLIGKMKAAAGQRDALIAILLDGIDAMPGCLSYIVARDPKDADAIWISEVWDSQDSHRASLALPSVKSAIAKARPMIASFDEHHEIEPIGGHGLTKAR